MSVSQVYNKIVSYYQFYDNSGGGVTISGGEPLFQPDFALKLLKSCKESGISTCVETCGYTDYKVLKSAMKFTDLILYDIKHMDDAKHREKTGVSNRLILSNLKKISKKEADKLVVRVPLICGFNDYEENIRRTAELVSSLNIQHLDMLPFNMLPSAKYKSFGIEWKYKHVKRQSDEVLKKIQQIPQSYGLEVTIGGLW